MLPMDNWDSLVSSGQLKLLKHEIVTELAGVYSRIKNSNYEAQVCRHAVEDMHRTPTVTLQQHWQKLSDALREREDALRKDLQSILNRPWWPN